MTVTFNDPVQTASTGVLGLDIKGDTYVQAVWVSYQAFPPKRFFRTDGPHFL